MGDARIAVVGDAPTGGDPADRVVEIREPEGAVGTGVMLSGNEIVGSAVDSDGPAGGDPADRVAAVVGEPQRAIGTGRDALRIRDAGVVVGNDPAART